MHDSHTCSLIQGLCPKIPRSQLDTNPFLSPRHFILNIVQRTLHPPSQTCSCEPLLLSLILAPPLGGKDLRRYNSCLLGCELSSSRLLVGSLYFSLCPSEECGVRGNEDPFWREPRLCCCSYTQSSLSCHQCLLHISQPGKWHLTAAQSGSDGGISLTAPARVAPAVLTRSRVVRNKESQVVRGIVLVIGSLYLGLFTTDLYEFVLESYLLFIPL